MRRCVDCAADISWRGRTAYLCLACVHKRHLEHDRRWHHEHLECGRESERRQRAKRPKPKCRACGAPRGRWRTYCDPCRKAFREITHTLAKKKYLQRLRDQSNTVEHSDFVAMAKKGSTPPKKEKVSIGLSHKPKPIYVMRRITLADLPTLTDWWAALAEKYPTVDLDAELLKAQDWHRADRVKSPKLYFRNWVHKAASWQPAQELSPDELRARLRVVA